MRSVKGIIDSIIVEIYERAVRDDAESEKQGLPIFNTVQFIKKRVANSRDVYDQPVKSTDRDRYPDLFRAFEAGESVRLNGTPLEEWPQLDAAQIQTLKSANILTVQALAELNETGMHRLPAGYMTLKTKAAKWLGQGAELERLSEENKELRARLDALEKKPRKKIA